MYWGSLQISVICFVSGLGKNPNIYPLSTGTKEFFFLTACLQTHSSM